MKYILTLLLVLTTTLTALWAQPDANLANQYFNDGEFEKAASLYEKLYTANVNSDYYFTRYLRCLNELKRVDELEALLKKRLKATPKAVWLYVEYGALLEDQDKADKAKEQYGKAIDKLPAEQPEVAKLAQAFREKNQWDWVVKTYIRGGELAKNDRQFAYELGEAYKQLGDTPKMIASYLDALEDAPARMTNVQAYFQRSFGTDDYLELQGQLFDRAQKDVNSELYPEMLSWIYVQQGDYKNALRQLASIDKRLQENGARVFRLAQTAKNEQEYDAAITGFTYITEQKGETCPFYFDAKREVLNCKRTKLTDGFAYTHDDLVALEKDYDTFLAEFGRTKQTAIIMSEYAQTEAFYLNNLEKAISIMNDVVGMAWNERSNNDLEKQAQAKLDLGDYYLMHDEPWDATLLYSQVDKAMKDAPLGEFARFKNAKLSYYQGDFEWAQGQLGALKASTSELISNDAIDLSVFILEHYGLDTTARPMELFARAELLNFQNRFDESFVVMDSIDNEFKRHTLIDHIEYVKADIYIKKRDYEKATKLLNDIAENHKDGILADNAIFRLAQLYENELQLNDKAKAKDLYEKIITDYSSSLFVIEARKRYRTLRGDKLDGVQ